MTITTELLEIRSFLLKEIDGSEAVELHLDRHQTGLLCDHIDRLAVMVNALEEQVIPEHLKQPLPKEGENIVVLDNFRKRRAIGGGGKGAA